MRLSKVPVGAIALAALALLALPGGFRGGRAESAPMAADPAAACASLSGTVVSAHQFSLPTSGARIASATFQVASGAGAGASPEYCKVLAKIAPVDPRSQPITVELNLPSKWNGKVVQMGGSGLNGSLITAVGPGPGANAQPAPLSIGYATFGSDGGHSVANPFDADGQTAAFLNDEVLANFAGDQLKKARDFAVAVIRLRYGKGPRRTYFVGASGGGREALNVAQKWGADYDGAISYYPAAGGVPLIVALGRDSRALAEPGAYPDPAKQALLHQAVVAACDAADGVVDGIVSNPAICKFNVASLRCPAGGDGGDTCLSDRQIAALNVMSTDLHLNYSLASGETGISGYRVFRGVDLTTRFLGLGASPPTPPPLARTEPIHYILFNVAVRGMITRDPNTNPLDFDPENPGAWTSRMSQLSSILKSSQPDLSRFARHGGKLILVHGKDDSLIPVGWSESYYRDVEKTMGTAVTDGFMRFYTVPGYGHGSGAFNVDWDSLTALDHWVETGVAPSEPVAIDINPPDGGRSRPLCRYPTWPRYNGTGDINNASSFTCARS